MSDALFYVLAVVIMGLSFVFLKRRGRMVALKHDPAGQADAARVGWQFETGESAMFAIYRWRGTTAGVTWVAEALRSGRTHTRGRSSTTFVRWHTLRPIQIAGPVAMLADGDGRDTPITPQLEGDGVIARLGGRVIAAVLDKAFDVRFGEEIGGQVDAGTLKSMPDVERQFPGSSVLVADAHRASALFVFQKLEAPLRSLAGSTPPLSLLIVPGGFAVSAKGWIRNVDELAPIVNAGVALVQAISESR